MRWRRPGASLCRHTPCPSGSRTGRRAGPLFERRPRKGAAGAGHRLRWDCPRTARLVALQATCSHLDDLGRWASARSQAPAWVATFLFGMNYPNFPSVRPPEHPSARPPDHL